MIPVSWIIGAVGVAIASIGGYRIGAGLTEAKYLKAAEARQSEAQTRRVGRAQNVGTETLARATVQEKYIREVVHVPIYRDAACVIPDSGLRLANEAITGKPRPPNPGVVP